MAVLSLMDRRTAVTIRVLELALRDLSSAATLGNLGRSWKRPGPDGLRAVEAECYRLTFTIVSSTRRDRTRARLEQAAFDLFERQGFDQTTVAQIAAAAEVAPMTFFRHFTTKPRVLLDDPYDPVIAAAVADQPLALDPLSRVVRGVQSAWASLPEADEAVVRRKVRIIAQTPSIASEMASNNAATEALIAEALVDDGVAPLAARAASAATMAAITAAMLEWATHDDMALGEALLVALETLGGRNG